VDQCPGYKALQGIDPTLTSSSASASSERPAKRQQTLQFGVQTISKTKKQKLDHAAAMAVYIGARPFALWENRYMQQFIDILSDSAYKAPARHYIGGELLFEAYKGVHSKVLSLLDTQTRLQFVLDESSDINHRRTINLSVVIPKYGSFYLKNKHIRDRDLTA
jgi:hypothetical protein